MKITFIVLFFFILNGCATFKSPKIETFHGFSEFKITPRTISFTVSADVMNPNKKKVKLHQSNLEVFLEGKKIGQLSNNEKVVIKSNRLSKVSVPVIAETERGALIRLAALSFKDSVDVKFVGEITGGIGIFKKKFPINESFKAPTRFLKINN